MPSLIERAVRKFVRLGSPTRQPDYARCYAQEGEDILLRRIFGLKNDGFYVDVGAHHPTRFSNTYFFYQRGWRGINIDAAPGSMEPFRKLRPRDINLEAAVSNQKETVTLYEFVDPALNTLSLDVARQHDGYQHHRIKDQITLETSLLSEILEQNLPPGQTIDFLTVDVEGLDFQVLSSNDWNRFRPHVVLAEDLGLKDLEHLADSQVYSFLHAQGYHLYCKTVNTLVFRENDVLTTGRA